MKDIIIITGNVLFTDTETHSHMIMMLQLRYCQWIQDVTALRKTPLDKNSLAKTHSLIN